MTLNRDPRRDQPEQSRTQKIVMWSIFGVAGVLAVIAIIIFFASGTRLF